MIDQLFKDTRPGGQLLALGLMFVLFFIGSTGILFIVPLFGLNISNLAMQCVTQIVVFCGTALFFAYMFYGNPLRHLRMAGTERLAIKMLAAFVIFILLLPLSDWLGRLNDAMHLPQQFGWLEDEMRQLQEKSQGIVDDFLLRDGMGALMANMFVLALIPAVSEEMLFRGALQQLMCRCFGNWYHIAIILTAAIFSLFHFELFAFLPRFALGIALGYLFHYGGSLWINATAHFANNAIAIILYYLANKGVVDIEQTESINAPFYMVVIGVALSLVLFWFIFIKRKNISEVNS